MVILCFLCTPLVAQWFRIFQCASYAITVIFWICILITCSKVDKSIDNDDTDDDDSLPEYRIRWYYIVIMILAIAAAVGTVLMILPMQNRIFKIVYFCATTLHLFFVYFILMVDFGGVYQGDWEAKSLRAKSYFDFDWSEWILFSAIYVGELLFTFESSSLPGAEADAAAPADAPSNSA